MTITDTPVNNGVNTDALISARTALRDAPELANFTWKATSEWKGGTYSVQTIKDFEGLGGSHEHAQSFTVSGDHPAEFAAEDRAQTPVETILAGLAGCLTGIVASVAQYRGIQLHKVNATVLGHHNILGILGEPGYRRGYDDIEVHFDIEADASPEEIEALVAHAQKRSAVFDALTNPTPVKVTVN